MSGSRSGARPRRLVLSGIAVAILVLMGRGGTWAGAQEMETLETTIVSASGKALEGGNSTTEFGLRLPEPASCPGDSADDGYRVNSYMVPAQVNPTDVTYDGTGPIPYKYGAYDDFRQPLYELNSNSFVSAQTADAERPGDPGPIINVPLFNFGVYGPGDLPAGRYHLGLTCTLLNKVTKVWDTEIVVSAAPGSGGAGVEWRAVDFHPSGGASNRSRLMVGLGAVLLVAAAVYLMRRRRVPRSLPALGKGK